MTIDDVLNKKINDLNEIELKKQDILDFTKESIENWTNNYLLQVNINEEVFLNDIAESMILHKNDNIILKRMIFTFGKSNLSALHNELTSYYIELPQYKVSYDYDHKIIIQGVTYLEEIIDYKNKYCYYDKSIKVSSDQVLKLLNEFKNNELYKFKVNLLDQSFEKLIKVINEKLLKYNIKVLRTNYESSGSDGDYYWKISFEIQNNLNKGDNYD